MSVMNFPLPFLRLTSAVLLLQVSAIVAAPPQPPADPAASPWIALARGRVEPPGGVVLVAANRTGIVKEILVHEGDHVVRGAVLATLDDDVARLRLALARRELAQAHAAREPLELRQAAARREAGRLTQLVEQQLANAQDLDQAHDRVAVVDAELAQAAAAEDTARAQVDLARYEVEARTIRAPMDGRILRRLASPGEGTSTEPVTPLFWLAPDGPRIVRAQLDEESAALVKPGQPAEVVTESAAGTVLRARVQNVGLLFGPRRPSTDDPAERQDVRVVDCVLVLEDATPPVLIGQRVVVRFLRPGPSAP